MIESLIGLFILIVIVIALYELRWVLIGLVVLGIIGIKKFFTG